MRDLGRLLASRFSRLRPVLYIGLCRRVLHLVSFRSCTREYKVVLYAVFIWLQLCINLTFDLIETENLTNGEQWDVTQAVKSDTNLCV